MGYEKLFVVHRLDCETSGVMVFARTNEAASKLSRCWRERDGDGRAPSKLYVARVRHWAPYHERKLVEGIIELSLAPSEKERLKWEVRELGEGGKSSKTLWRLYHGSAEKGGNDMEHSGNGDEGQNRCDMQPEGQSPVILALTPVTGRTHQLRVHCAAFGSGIEGDSLYGDNPIGTAWDPKDPEALTLKLHAQELSFVHPGTGERVEFKYPAPYL